jgi:hypothetical protein
MPGGCARHVDAVAGGACAVEHQRAAVAGKDPDIRHGGQPPGTEARIVREQGEGALEGGAAARARAGSAAGRIGEDLDQVLARSAGARAV